MKYLFVYIFLVVSLFACQKETSDPPLIAMYNFSVKGPEVTFTNMSGYFDEYSWDFGDGNSSTEKAPRHTYKEEGKYFVTLTARKGSYSDTFSDSVYAEAPTITIDGDFIDWNYITVEWKNPDNYSGTLTRFKSHYSDTHIFLFIEGTSAMTLEPFQIYFDTDGNPTTGYKGTELFSQGCGFEMRHEGDTKGWSNVQKFTGATPTQWDAVSIDVPSDYLTASDIISKDGKKYCEIAIKKEVLMPLAKTIHIGIREINWSWQPTGLLPYQPGSDLTTMIPVQTRK